MHAVSACTSAGSVAGNIAIRSWLRPSLRYGSTSTIPFARSVAASAAASTWSSKSIVPDDERALGRVGDERRRVRVRCRPAVEVRRGGGRACDHRRQTALREHPVELVGEQEQRRDRRRVVGLVLDRVLERGRQRQRLGNPAAARARAVDLGDPLLARRGSAARATARRRTRSPSAARSSTRRSGRRRPAGRRRPEVASISTSASPAAAGRTTGTITPVEVSLCAHAMTSAPFRRDRPPAPARRRAAPRSRSGRAGTAPPRVHAANFEENSP